MTTARKTNSEENQVGVSLWQDAWRRLKKNRPAVAGACVLIVVGMLAIFTPVLPLQSPTVQAPSARRFLPPNLAPMRIPLRADLAQHDELLIQLNQELAEAPADKRTELAKTHADRARHEHPFRKHWNNPNGLTRVLLQLRVLIFGDWCLPSLCGTDDLGRDVLARLLWGARVSLMVGLVATLVSLLIGVTYGAVAGYVGGWVDNLLMRIVDMLYSIPFIFVVILLITFLSEASIKKRLEDFGIDRITIFYLVIGAIFWLTMSRVVRGQVISLKNEQFVDAARALGATTPRIIFRHLLPNVMGVVIVYLTLTIPAVMLFESFLSFLGLGVSDPDVSWGLLIDAAVQVITPVRTYWWLVLFPGGALTMTLFALNFLGDGLRDALDPRLKNRG